VLRDRIHLSILRVRLPLTVANAAGQRAGVRTLTGPYYGWVLVGALGVTETISWGVLYYAFSVFLTPMEADLGWSRGETTGAFSLAMVLSAFTAIGVGRWMDRHGGRVLMTTGWRPARARVGVHQHVAGAVPGVGRHGNRLGDGAVRPRFCGHHGLVRSQARARADRGDPDGGLCEHHFSAALRLVGRSAGVAPSTGALAALLAVGTIPAHALLLRRRPEDLGLHPDGRPTQRTGTARTMQPGVTLAAALRDPTFRWVTLAFCLSTAVAFGAQLHLVPILLERGFSPTLAATIAGLIGATQVVGRVLMTPFTGRVSLRSLSVAVLALQPVALLVLLLDPTLAGVIGFVVLFGAAKGCMTLVRPALVADLYGPAHYASIAGVVAFAVTMAQAAAPLGAGAAYDALGRYDPILGALVVVSALASLCLLPVRRATNHVAEPQRA
jgi:cyanate permease